MVDDVYSTIDVELLMEQVHSLAYYYHWGYEEIMNMTMRKRMIFSQLLRKQIKRENDSANSTTPSKSTYKESR